MRTALQSLRRIGFITTSLAALGAVGCAGNSARSDNPVMSLIDSIMPPSPSEAAKDALNPFDADRRRSGVAWLSSAPFGGEEVYVRTYRLLLTDEDSTVRAAAVRALGLHGVVDDVDLLIPLLEDQSDVVRWETAKALQKIHNPKAIDPLIKHTRLATEESADVRMASSQALGQYAEPRVFDALVGALNDTNFGVTRAARGALKTLTGYDLGSDSTLWLIWQKKNAQALFAQREEYTWQPFEKPPTTLEKMQFWKDEKVVEPQKPVGLDQPLGG